MAETTIAELARWTGFSPKVIGNRLAQGSVEPIREEGRSRIYDSQKALPAIYGVAREVEEEGRDLEAERTRLTRIQADMKELALLEKEGLLLDAEDVSKEWGQLVMEVKSGFMAMPRRLAPMMVGLETASEAETIIEENVMEVLERLASGNGGISKPGSKPAKVPVAKAGGNTKKNRKGGNGKAKQSKPAKASAKTKGKRVGRPGKGSKPRGKRGAGTVED